MTVVAVAMSGGVDSSAAAALILDEGHEVFGLTMETGFGPAAGPAAAEAARRLGIDHYTVTLGPVFRERVLDPFCLDYEGGRTPNPCVACNRWVKFGALLERALELGADCLATGHYARVEEGEDGFFHLLRGIDRRKDQSYFLYALGQAELSRTLFPLGHLTKREVRRLAAERGLPAASRPESQDVCFLSAWSGRGRSGTAPGSVTGGFTTPGSSYGPFIESLTGRKPLPGPIVDLAGRRVGTHRGLVYYTVGQRRGLGLASSRPLYVVALRSETNELVVGPAEALLSSWLEVDDPSFVLGDPPPEGADLEVRVRYRSREARARLTYRTGSGEEPGRWSFSVTPPQKAVAPGQSAVLYHGDEVVGGGVVTRTETTSCARQ